jgi:hypothetical protein
MKMGYNFMTRLEVVWNKTLAQGLVALTCALA